MYYNHINRLDSVSPGQFTWCCSLVGYRMMFADHLTIGSNTTKVQYGVHQERTNPGKPLGMGAVRHLKVSMDIYW